LLKEKENLTNEKDLLLKSTELAEGQLSVLKRSLEVTQKDLKDKDKQVIYKLVQQFAKVYMDTHAVIH
jgi:hypothetical protein